MENKSEYEELYNKNWLKSEKKLIELKKKHMIPPYIRPKITTTGVVNTGGATTIQ